MKPLDLGDLEILSVHYDESQPNCEPGTFCGVILRSREKRQKILYIYENGITDTAWIEPKPGGLGSTELTRRSSRSKTRPTHSGRTCLDEFNPNVYSK
jgi:hypothetical protein